MPFIEKSDSALQVIVHHLKKSGEALEFVIIPMIRIGTQEFYDEVSQSLSSCDLVLAEGVNSTRVGWLSLPYRIGAKSFRIRLKSQKKALNMAAFKDKIVPSDIDGRSFDKKWTGLKLRWRGLLLVLVPFAAFYFFFFINREQLASYALRKNTTSKSELRDEDSEQLARLMGGDRNQILIGHIRQLYETRKTEKIKVAIPYGVKHAPKVVRFLVNKLGYRVIKREWLTVFDFTCNE